MIPTAAVIKQQLELELQREGEELEELDEQVWQVLVKRRLVGEAQQKLLTIEELADKYCEYRDVLASRRQVRRPRKERHDLPTDSRLEVLSDLLALEASRRTDVAAFRQAYLAGSLLSRGEVEAWTKRQADLDGPPRPIIEATLPDDCETKLDLSWPGVGPIPRAVEPPLTLTHVTGERQVFLAYQAGGKGGVCREVVRPGGALDQLRQLAVTLASDYEWTEDQASTFVLTGLTPLIPKGRVTLHYKAPLTVLNRVVLDLDPHVAPREVLAIYRKARSELLEGRYRPLSQKHLELARFYGSHEDQPWRKLLCKWNDAHPEWSYSEYRNFSRDCRQAWRRIFGESELVTEDDQTKNFLIKRAETLEGGQL